MHFTDGQNKLLTHIKMKRFYISFFSLQSANQMLQNRPFLIKKGLPLPTSPLIVHKPFPIQNKIDKIKSSKYMECEKNYCNSIFFFDNRNKMESFMTVSKKKEKNNNDN